MKYFAILKHVLTWCVIIRLGLVLVVCVTQGRKVQVIDELAGDRARQWGDLEITTFRENYFYNARHISK